MIPIIIITHGALARELVKSAELIMGKAEAVYPQTFMRNDDYNELERRVGKQVEELMTDEGIIILVDLFGGSCLNICSTFFENDKIEIFSGANLPLLLEIMNYRYSMDLKKIIKEVRKVSNNLIVNVKDRFLKFSEKNE